MAHPDMDALLNEALRVAVQLLEKNGEFFPFGLAMAPDGAIVHLHGAAGGEHPPSQQVIALLLAGMRQGAAAGKYRASALVCDVRLRTPDGSASDAVSVAIEHREHDPVTCCLPYAKKTGLLAALRARRPAFAFSALMAIEGERQVFLPGATAPAHSGVNGDDL